jgi:hypothetical protein
MATDNPTFQEQAKALAHRLADGGLGAYEGRRQAYARFYAMLLAQAQAPAYVDTIAWGVKLPQSRNALGSVLRIRSCSSRGDRQAAGPRASETSGLPRGWADR